jgi:hypothetical protein
MYRHELILTNCYLLQYATGVVLSLEVPLVIILMKGHCGMSKQHFGELFGHLSLKCFSDEGRPAK